MKKVDIKVSVYGEKFLTFAFDDHIKNEEIESQVMSMINSINIDTEKTYNVTVAEYNEEEYAFYNDWWEVISEN